MLNETEKERKAREQAEEQRRIDEARNVQRLQEKVSNYKSTLHVAESEQQHLIREVAEIRAKAETEAAQKLAQVETIKGNMPKLRTLLARAEHELRVIRGQKSKTVIAATSTLGL